jgi:hypothetical protein
MHRHEMQQSKIFIYFGKSGCYILGTRESPGEDLIAIEAHPSSIDAVGPLWTNLATASE